MATYVIRGKRWLRKYTAAQLTPSYGTEGEVETMASRMCGCPWEEAAPLDACLPSHAQGSMDGNAANRDYFDAACFCGEHADGLHRVFGQAACYVFALPDAAVGVGLASVTARVVSDPYCAEGARLALHLSDTLSIPTACSEARAGAAHADAVARRSASTGADGSVTWTGSAEDAVLAPPAGTALKKYLMLVVAPEGFTARAGYAEGAAHILNSVTLSTGAAVQADGWEDGSAEPVDCTGAEQAAVPADYGTLHTTGYPDNNLIYINNKSEVAGVDNSGNASVSYAMSAPLHVTRLFAGYGMGWVAAVGGDMAGDSSLAGASACAPALRIIREADASSSSDRIRYLCLGTEYTQAEPTEDIDADWAGTAPGAMLRAGRVTGVFLALNRGQAALGAPGSRFHLYASDESGLWLCGSSGYYPMASGGHQTYQLIPGVKRAGDGGELIVARRVGQSPSSSPFSEAMEGLEWLVECASASGGSVRFGTREVAVDGEVSRLGAYEGEASGLFTVCGDLRSVGGVRCRHVAVVDTRHDRPLVSVPDIDPGIEPNTYRGFRVVRAGGSWHVLGDFTRLGGTVFQNGTSNRKGGYMRIKGDGSGTVTYTDTHIADVTAASASKYYLAKAEREED